MAVRFFGRLADGTEIEEIALSAPAGLKASIITFGAALRDLIAPLPDGAGRRAVLGYPVLEPYLSNSAYLGATVGRYASRIGGGRLRIDGVTRQLSLNDGDHHLHGGAIGFSHRPWRIVDADENATTLALVSPDGDQGYPGAVEARCAYRLLDPATLRVALTASTDAPTVVSLAHHSYFNLAPSGTIRAHRLTIDAGFYVPFDSVLIPTGEIRSVAATPYDFRRMRSIEDGPEGKSFAYDVCLVLNRGDEGLFPAAALQSPDGALTMDVHTTEPCIVFYDGAKLSADSPGLDGKCYFPHAGLCLEPIRYPDSVNQPRFPQALLRPGALYRQVTEYRFRT